MRILVFAPHAEIWVHAFPEALIAESLRDSGNEIIYVSCGGLLERFCVPMEGHRLTPASSEQERGSVCRDCQFNDRLLRTSFSFSGPSLRDVLTPADFEEADRMLDSCERSVLPDLKIDGVPVGQMAFYQIMLKYKRFDFELSEPEWRQYVVELRHTLLAAKATRKLIDLHRPDRLIVYNALYSVNRVASTIAESCGVPAYFLHAGTNLANRLQTMMLGRGNTFDWFAHVRSQWPRFSATACPPENLSLVSDHFLELVRGQNVFVYSSKQGREFFDLRTRFGVTENQKVLVATMSSYDEEIAARTAGVRKPQDTCLFPRQVDWILALVEFVRARPDLFLVVRVHPREFPNRREGVKSQHAALLQRVFTDLPDNVKVNWPDDDISLYDLVDQTDVFLNAWSAAGKEMAMLGVPVVIYGRDLPLYPADLNYLGETREQYFARIEEALRDGWSFEIARRAYRWLALEFITATVFLGDSYPKVEHPHRSFASKVRHRLMRALEPHYEKRADIRRRAPQLNSAQRIHDTLASQAVTPLEITATDEASISYDQETVALRRELMRIGEALFPTTRARTTSRLFKRLAMV